MLDLRRLRLLRELARLGTIAAVAEHLAFSPSSVSQQLAQLEREAGTRLLQKSGRRVRLTAEGELVVAHAERLLDQMERLETELAGVRDAVAGTVRLAVFQSAALGIVPRALTLLSSRHPQLRVEVTQHEPETALAAVWAREFDLVIAEEYPHHAAPRLAELDREPLVGDAIRLGAPAGIDSLEAAARLPWVMEPRGTASRHWAEQTCRVAGFEPDVRFETADLQAHIRLIEAGHAVALLPDLVWAGRAPSVHLVELAGAPRRTVFTSARRAGRDSAAIRAVRGILADAVEASRRAPVRDALLG
ncbi:LysR family transcriptional regulator [Homoserinibacter sp. YIM 151385]|uniref:LysR family transcriptional regulator n=1 Tax=Homoserinibacter sp. YIM 151385 TaxID=2985506 RepID=UPI0022F11FA7|nr:LysR family transcriptional regulator [Homoserinibacter sp. YIM 151385]WBU37162.1 LysR family transcriptional regulator [Homoserinibacter sp. YIM 151385]